MGAPDTVLLKVEGDDKEYWVPAQKVDQFFERMNGAGFRVTRPAALGPMSAQHYGPERPALDQERTSPSSGSALSDAMNANIAKTGKLPIVPVSPQPDFSVAAPEDMGAPADTDASLAAAGLDAGVDLDAGVASESPELGAQDSVPDKSRAALLAARERAAAAARGIPRGARTTAQGVGAPAMAAPGELESFGRGYLDQAGFGLSDEAAGGWAMLDELIPRVRDAFSGALDPDRLSHYAQTTERGVDAPLGPQYSTAEAVARAGERGMAKYAAEEDAARETNPVAYTGGSMLAAVPQAAAARWLGPGATGAAQAEAAAARSAAAGGTEGWALRTMEGVKDALFNPANVASAALSGAGHVRHDAGDSALDYAAEAGAGTAGELTFGAMASPFATALLGPFRAIGRRVADRLSDPLANQKAAHLHQAAKNAGATYETFHKPLGRPGTGPLTGARGLRPGEEMQAALADARARGVAQPVERQRGQVAGRVANVLDDEAQNLDLDLRKERDKHYIKPEAAAKDEVTLEVLRSAPPDIKKEIVAQMEGIEQMRAQQGRPRSGMDAEMLDQIIDHIDRRGKTHLELKTQDAAHPYTELAARLREIRRERFKGAAWISEAHAEKMREHEAKKTQFGIPANTKGVKRTPRSEHIQAIDKRLSQGQPDMLLQTIRDMEVTDPETGKLLRQWSGLDAQHRLLTGLEEELGPVIVRNTGQPAGVSARALEWIKPGMRIAGLENLGENSQAAVRGGLAAAAPAFTGTPQVTPEQVANIAAFLGYGGTTPTAEGFERIRQILGLQPEQMEQYRTSPP